MDVVADATRTWRFHAAADFGETEKARERAARVRDGVLPTLRTACAEIVCPDWTVRVHVGDHRVASVIPGA